MMPTRLFKNGNSQAVRIPAELAYERTDLELEIERVGDEIHVRPARKKLEQVLKTFARFSADFSVPERGEQQQKEREPL